MTQKWSRKFSQCQQCGTIRFKHVAKGLCTRCYRLVRRLEQVNQWDPTDHKSLKGYPYRVIDESFDRLKSEFIRELRERLKLLRVREELLLRGPVSGLQIEFQLKNIVSLCGLRRNRRNPFHGTANLIEESLDLEQRRVLYELLNTVEENLPWFPKWNLRDDF